MNSLDKMEDYDRLARLCKAKDAEIKRLAISEVDLEQKVHVLEAQIAIQAEALGTLRDAAELHGGWSGTVALCNKTISASAETVAAWRAKETEPLLSKIAELETNERAYEQIIGSCTYQEVADERNKLRREVATLRDTLVILDKYIPVGSTIKVLEDTQATALAYEQEVKAKALEDTASKFICLECPAEDELTKLLAEAKSKAVPEWMPINTAPKDGTLILACGIAPPPDDDGFFYTTAVWRDGKWLDSWWSDEELFPLLLWLPIWAAPQPGGSNE